MYLSMTSKHKRIRIVQYHLKMMNFRGWIGQSDFKNHRDVYI